MLKEELLTRIKIKKYIIIATVLLLAGACSKQPISPVPQPSPMPAPNSDWQTYRNINYNFEFKYPENFGFGQPEVYFLKDPVVQLESPKNEYPGTNYAGSMFTIAADFAQTPEKCLVSQMYGKPLTIGKVIKINGVDFYSDAAAGAAAGNFYNSTIYKTWRDSLCLEIVLTIHTTNIQNYPEGNNIQEVDQSKPMAVLEQMLNTFIFKKFSPLVKIKSEGDYIYYKGEITLSGTYKDHYIHDMGPFLCFYADADSAYKIPREDFDPRVAWFCFNNQDTVRQALEIPKNVSNHKTCPELAGAASIIVKDYVVNKAESEVFDEATLVKVLSKEPAVCR